MYNKHFAVFVIILGFSNIGIVWSIGGGISEGVLIFHLLWNLDFTKIKIINIILNSIAASTKILDEYEVILESDSPVVLGANITIRAHLYTNGKLEKGQFQVSWKDNAIPRHSLDVSDWNVV